MSESKQSDRKMRSLMQENNLDYQAPADVSVGKSRVLSRTTFEKTTYSAPGDVSSVTFNISDAYINADNSYIQFDLSVLDGTESKAGDNVYADFSAGPLNAIQGATFTSKSGEKIDSVNYSNFRNYAMLPWEHSKDSFDTNLSVMKHGFNAAAGAGKDWSSAVNTDPKVIVPLRYILPMFNMHGDKLIPAELLRGGRLDIYWAPAALVFNHSTAAAPTSATYSISNAAVYLDSVVLADGVLSVLKQQMASSMGLPLSFDSFDDQKEVGTSTDTVIVRSTTARSKVKKAHLVLCTPQATEAAKFGVNSLNGLITNWVDGYYKHGDVRYPPRPIQGSATSQMEVYGNNQYVAGGLSGLEIAVPYSDSMATGTARKINPMSCSLETTFQGALSGRPTASGKALVFEGSLAAAVSWDAYLFTKFATRLQLFSSKVVLTR